jgi:alpha-2-macroglobulin
VGDDEKAGVLVENLETTAKVDDANGTVHWQAPDRFWWRWYNNDVETNAAALRALVALRPQSRLTPMLVRWLVNNRRGSIWHSTRETAMAVYALADYIRLTREVAPEYTVTVDVDGRVRREYTVTADNALLFDNRFVVPDALLRDGAQRITITKQGPGHLYYSAYLRTFSLEEGIAAAGSEIAVRRRHFKLIPEVGNLSPGPSPKRGGVKDGASGELNGPSSVQLTYRRIPIEAGAALASGDLIETELFLEAQNDYDYVVFEDMKPAGCEPVELRSGGTYGDGLCANMELRDQKVAFFVGRLPQGTRRLTYRLRAEIPGEFHVLPTNGYAMYAPDVRAISDEARFGIRDTVGDQQARK